MKKYGRIITALAVSIVFGLALAACDGRVSSVWFALETAAMVILTSVYFFGIGESGNTLQSCITSFICAFVPIILWVVIVREKTYFGYSSGKLIGGSLVCALVLFLCIILTRHETGPLRAAFGRNLLPAFFGAAGLIRLIKYFKDLESFTISFKDKLCVHGLLFMLFAIGVFIAANRSKLARLESYIAVAVWGGAFALLHILDPFKLPVLEPK